MGYTMWHPKSSEAIYFVPGLVEIITESETLRKIQVKYGHGLAGSFKDRPIAEWLQVQNPTELEYQKVGTRFRIKAWNGLIFYLF